MMEIEKEMEVDGSIIRATQKTGGSAGSGTEPQESILPVKEEDGSVKVLEYDYKKCNGCGICIALCPKKALASGPVIEIATGLDAPPVLIDIEACAFCGMCAAFCPVNAYSFKIDGKDILEDEAYPHLKRSATPNERCLPCALCQPVCPTKAIDVRFNVTREDLGPLRAGIDGSIAIDMDKCNFCGICERFCKAFLLIDKEQKDPRDLMPFDQLLVDTDQCDYCGLCVALCPEEAIAVVGEPLILEQPLGFKGEIRVDQSLCIGCGRCDIVCPYDAMDVIKPMDGDIRLLRSNLAKCDPLGCHGCFNVCPADCWYVGQDGKIAVVDDQCILCGACARACHCFGIDVERKSVSHTDVMQTPWASEWKEAINSILTGVRMSPDVSLALSPPHVERKVRPLIAAPPKDPALQRMVDERLKRIEPLMRKPKVRYIWERDPIKEAGRKIAIRMRTSAANKVGKGSTNRENAAAEEAAAANEQKGELL